MSSIDLSNECVAFTCSKSANQIAGTFSLTLVPRDVAGQTTTAVAGNRRVPWMFNVLKPMTPVAIGYDVPGGIMFGLVKARDYTLVAVNGQVTMGLTIQGEDIGCVFNDQLIYIAVTQAEQPRWESDIKAVLGENHPVLKDLKGPIGVIRNGDPTPILENLTIEEIVPLILRNVATMQIPIFEKSFGGKGTVADALNVTAHVRGYPNEHAYCTSLFQQEGTVESFFKQILDTDFYELRIDSKPRENQVPQPYLIIHPKPFDEPDQRTPAWASVKYHDHIGWDWMHTFVEGRQYHEIDARWILDLKIGTEAAEAFDYYTVVNNNEIGATESDMSAGRLNPLMDLYIAKFFGNKRYEAHRLLTDGTPFKLDERGNMSETDKASILQGSIESRNRLFNWYRANPYMLNGSLTTSGVDEYRAGDPIYLPNFADVLSGAIGVKGYISSVTHAWSLGSLYTCNLSVQRLHGQGFWQAFIDMVKAEMPAENPYGWTAVPSVKAT